MVQTWNIETSEALSFQGLIDFFECRGQYPLSGHDLDEAAMMMRRILNNREDVCRYLVENLTRLLEFRADDYAPDGIVLYRSKHFILRMVIWLPDGMKGHQSGFTDSTLHDHNYNFMTLGLLGPGYQTDVWQYDPKLDIDQTGESVAARRQGILQLAEGCVFYFQKGVDIHSQLPPEKLSVSFNIMESDEMLRMQYEFNQLSPTEDDHLHVATLVLPPVVQQISQILGNSPLRDRLQNVLEKSKFAGSEGLAGNVLRRSLKMLASHDARL